MLRIEAEFVQDKCLPLCAIAQAQILIYFLSDLSIPSKEAETLYFMADDKSQPNLDVLWPPAALESCQEEGPESTMSTVC